MPEGPEYPKRIGASFVPNPGILKSWSLIKIAEKIERTLSTLPSRFDSGSPAPTQDLLMNLKLRGNKEIQQRQRRTARSLIFHEMDS